MHEIYIKVSVNLPGDDDGGDNNGGDGQTFLIYRQTDKFVGF